MSPSVERMKQEIAAVRARLAPRAEIACQAAQRRHNARLAILVWQKMDVRLPGIAAMAPELDPDGEPWNPPAAPPPEVREALALLDGDTPKQWAADQSLIEAYHLTRYGHTEYARSWAFGRDAESMWRNYWVRVSELPGANAFPEVKAILAQATNDLENEMPRAERNGL